MVYIPWANYGICKFWMLKRCWTGDECQYQHPPPAERQRLWDDMTAAQDAEAAVGIPRPVNPRKAKEPPERPPPRDDSPFVGDEWDDIDAQDPSDLMPPPTLPPPSPRPWPPPAETETEGSHDTSGCIDTFRFPYSFAGRGHAMTKFHDISWPPETAPRPAPDVSMLDAPGSPDTRKSGVVGSQTQRRSRWDIKGEQTQQRSSTENMNVSGFKDMFEADALASGTVGGVTEGHVQGEQDAAVSGEQQEISGQLAEDEDRTRGKKRRLAIGAKEEGEVEESKPEASDATADERKASAADFTPSPFRKSTKEQPTRKASTTLLTADMGATKRMANGEVKHVGPHPSTIRVSARYASQAAVEKRLQPQPSATGAAAQPDVQERLTAEAREDGIRLQGCRWIDDVRRQMQLPIRTYTTACTYYHKFRLAHPQHVAGMEYGNAWADACAASLLTACKVEDTLKKSKDILAAAHNLRAATTGGEQVGTDDAMFEAPSRVVIGLERLVLEAGSFDFRSKYPHELMVKIAKTLDGDAEEKRAVTGLAWTVLTDLHRTFAPLKQTSASMAVASLELASHLYASSTSNDSSAVRDGFANFNFEKHSTTRDEVMETILDALDLYTHHTLQTLLGSKYGLDDYLRIRLAFNKECTENNVARYTVATPRESEQDPSGNTLHVQNGHPTPVSPPQPETQPQAQQQTNGQPPAPEAGGTQRFMLNPQLAADEKSEVQKFFTEDWEEYEEEIEVPIPRAPSPDRMSDRSDHPRRPPLTGPPRAPPPRGDYRGPPPRYDDRRPRYDDRRYDDRRYEERRGGRYDDRRYDDRRRERR